MSRLTEWTLLVFFLILSPLAHASELYLSTNESINLPTPPSAPVRIQRRGLVRVVDQGSQLRLTGRKLGSTEIQVGEKVFHLHILGTRQRQSLQHLRLWAEQRRGPTLAVVDGEIQLQGRLLTLSDLESLRTLPATLDFANQTHPLPQLRDRIQDWLSAKLRAKNLAPAPLDFDGHWTLRLANSQRKQLSLYRHVASDYGIDVQIDPEALAQRPVIEIQVFIAHLKSHFLRQWGVEWPAQVQAQIAWPAQSAQGLQPDEIRVGLQALEGSGQGQVLATPTLLAESGAEAHFHSGGEFPIRTTTQFNNNVQWKRYGLFLKATPRLNALGHLAIGIEIEMSSLDQNQTTDGVPALVRSQIKTHLNMKKLSPIVVSGFLKEERSKGQSGLPWLQQIPLLRPLFATGQIYNDELDLVFILVPKIRET